MSLFGRILAAPFRIANVPLRVVEKIAASATDGNDEKEDRVVSRPLEALAEAVEEVVDGEDE